MTRIHGVLVPVRNLPADVAFYSELLGDPPVFVDGDRYAALPHVTEARVGLAAGEEAVTDRIAILVRTDDIAAARDRAVDLGGQIVTDVETGPHELRAVVLDPSGNPLVLTQPL